jgi:CheY-like chemotaxis protein
MEKIELLDKQGNPIYEKEYEDITKFNMMALVKEAKAELDPDVFKKFSPRFSIKKINNKRLFPVAIRRVMAVEDDPTTLKSIIFQITANGHYVEGYPFVEDALAVYKRSPFRFELILTDNMMPHGESGSALAKKIKDENEAVKIYIISGNTSTIDKDVFDHGVDGIISKPLDLLSLNNILDNINGTFS